MKRDAVAEVLVSANLIFAVAAFGAVEPWSAPVTAALSWAALAACAGRLTLRAFPAIEVVAPLAALGLIAAFQALNAADWPGPSPSLLTPSTPSSFVSLERGWDWASLAAFAAAAACVYRDSGARRRALWLLLGLGAFISVVGVAQQAQNEGVVTLYGIRSAGPGMNPFGPFYNRNHAACVMAIAFWCGIGACTDRFNSREAGAGRALEAALIAACGAAFCAACLWGVQRSGSYGAMAGLAFGAFFAAAAGATTMRWRALAALALIVGASSATALLLGEGWSVAERSESWALRREILRGSLSLWLERPLWGYGAGAFEIVYGFVRPIHLENVVDFAHNDWLEFLFETGVAGFLFVAGGAAVLAARVWRGVARTDRWAACGAAGACGAFAVHGFADFCLRIPGSRLPFLAAAAILCVVSSPRPEASLPEFRARWQTWAYSFLALISLRPTVAWSVGVERAASIHPSARNLRFVSGVRLRAGDAAASPEEARVEWRAGLAVSERLLRVRPADIVGGRQQSAFLRRLGRENDAARVSAFLGASHE